MVDGNWRYDLPGRTFAFACQVVRLCRSLNRNRDAPRAVTGRLLKAATSVGANVEEGQASQSTADFVAKYAIACKESREAYYWLRLLVATDIVPKTKVADLLDEANQLVAILASIVKKKPNQ